MRRRAGIRKRYPFTHAPIALLTPCNRLFYILRWDAKKDTVTGKKMKMPMELSERLNIARELHHKFYTALGEGDMHTLQKIACSGLLSKCKARIDRRRALGKANEPWVLKRYLGIPYPRWLEKWPLTVLLPNAGVRVVSDKMTLLPIHDSYLRQCVVRIRSLQDAKTMKDEKSHLKPYTEFVVLQKMYLKGEEADWRIWGTVKEDTMEEIEQLLQKGKGPSDGESLAERVRNRMTAVTGM